MYVLEHALILTHCIMYAKEKAFTLEPSNLIFHAHIDSTGFVGFQFSMIPPNSRAALLYPCYMCAHTHTLR